MTFRLSIPSALSLALTHVLAFTFASNLTAQIIPGPRDAFIMEQRVGDRWLHSAQHPVFTPFRDARSYTVLSPQVADASGMRTMVASLETGTRINDIVAIRFVLAADGRITSIEASTRPPSVAPGADAADSIVSLNRASYESVPARFFIMPEARVWELVPIVRITQFQRGARWTDTFSLSASANVHSQTLSGIRTSVVLGDTTVDGTRLWIISDSSDATFTERFVDRETSLSALLFIERRGRGTIRGRYLFDPAQHLFRARYDTTALSGTVTLRYPDGRTFSTPAKFDRRREFTLHTLRSFSARTTELARYPEVGTDRGPNSPFTPLAQRVIAGEPKASDSLFAIWSSTPDPLDKQRAVSFTSPAVGSGWGAGLTTRINAARRAAGDSALIVAELLARSREWTVAIVRDVLIPILADPAGVLAHGQRRDVFFVTLTRLLNETPPAITRDTAAWPLQPAVYDFIAQQGRTATDSRLQDLGLLSLFARDPRRWADSVRVRARAGSTIVTEAALVVDGATAYSMGTTLPDSGATWQQWHRWIIGPTPAARGGGVGRDRAMTFSAAHMRAIRMFEARIGRPVAPELRRNLATATVDSARLVYSTILQGLGEMSATADELAGRFRSGSATEIQFARATLPEMFRVATPGGRGQGPASSASGAARPVPVDSATHVAITSRLIESILRGANPLLNLEQKRNLGAGARMFLPPVNDGPGSFFNSDNLPAATIARFRSTAAFLRSTEWTAENLSEGRQVNEIGNVVHVGPIVQVRVAWSAFSIVNGVRRGGGGSGVLYLLQIDGDWVVVHQSGAVS